MISERERQRERGRGSKDWDKENPEKGLSLRKKASKEFLSLSNHVR